MLGPIIVSSVAISLPVVAGLWLAPRQESRRPRWMPINRFRNYVRSLRCAGEVTIPMEDLQTVLR